MSGRRQSSKATALPLRARARNVSYREPSSDVDFGSGLESNECSPPKTSKRPSRKRPRVSYNGGVSDTDSDASFNGDSSLLVSSRGSKKPHVSTRSPSSAATTKPRPRSAARPKGARQAVGAKRAPNPISETNGHPKPAETVFDGLQLGGEIPPWQTLPYEVLLQIFQYASYPLVTPTFLPSPSIAWLYGTALLCKGFAEPALAALYYAPPLYPPSRAYGLLASLEKDVEGSFMNYRAKIKYLDLDADQILCRKYAGREPMQMGNLLALTPQVRGIGLHLPSDLPRWRTFVGPRLALKAKGRVKAYQLDTFSTLTSTANLRLVEWTWNGKLAQQSGLPMAEFNRIHQSNAFKTLEHLTFTSSTSMFGLEWFGHAAGAFSHLKAITLTNLEDDMQSIKLLPKTLEHLDISNSSSLDAVILTEFMASHGAKIRELVLNHNDSVDLSFLQTLASSCPILERLKMDLTFYNTHFTFKDSEPKFETLLVPDVTPTWPSGLQRLEMFHLRKWDTAAAYTFFSSLVESAENLADLRHIDIKASLGESNWRDRISFRNKWISRMENVFKRVSPPPDPRLQSLSLFQTHRKEIRQSCITVSTSGFKVRDSDRFSHIEVQSPNVSSNTSGDSDTPLASKRRSTRTTRSGNQATDFYRENRKSRRPRKRKNRISEDSSSTEEDSALEDNSLSQHPQNDLGDEADKELFVQGMCDVVRVVIDNLRPTETHLNEGDFLDDEISGDEDWVGDDDGDRGEGYAW
ncbi:MAG: hypothetical protein LQ350_005306 [Teloschistes chrysophthalmus]|nr:MAG: hypothetical protein LQ350_005306 [Niorma chrysophthalma]